MSMQGRIGRAGGVRMKRALGVQAILEWAFRVEKAQLELPQRQDIDGEGFGFGMEYVLIQRAILGCKVDGGGRSSQSYTHQDAEIVAATLAGMPDSLGGIRMAIQVAELARAGMTPDWLPGVVPRCVPLEIKNNQHGERAKTIASSLQRRFRRLSRPPVPEAARSASLALSRRVESAALARSPQPKIEGYRPRSSLPPVRSRWQRAQRQSPPMSCRGHRRFHAKAARLGLRRLRLPAANRVRSSW